MNTTSPEIAQLLSQLKEVHPPEPIGWWPPAIGWWIVLALGLTLGIFIIVFTIKAIRQHRWQKMVSTQLALVSHSGGSEGDGITQLNRLLKQLLKVKHPTAKVASLHGDSWVNFLMNKYGATSPKIDLTPLAIGAYKPSLDVDMAALISDVKTWVKKCC